MRTISKLVNIGEIEVDIDIDLDNFSDEELEDELAERLLKKSKQILFVKSKYIKEVIERIDNCILTLKDERKLNTCLTQIERENYISV